MKLEIGNFAVRDVVFGKRTCFQNGILTINEEEAIQALNPEGKLKNVKLHIAKPGESVRILPVKEIVEARTRPDGRAVFPGETGPTKEAGNGQVYALKGMTVMAVGKYGGWEEGILDMSGPGAELSHYSKQINVCFTAEDADPDVDQGQHQNLNFRKGAKLLGEYLGKTVKDQEPETWEGYDLDEWAKDEKGLPRVMLVMQLNSFYEIPGYDDTFYGVDVMYLLPPLIHPNEVLDGALCSGAICISGYRAFTYDYQNHPLIKRLYAEHGKTLNFVGVIFSMIGQTLERKERGIIRVAETAAMMQCDGVIFTEPGVSNADIDLFNGIIRLEEKGIKCVAVTDEDTGRNGRNDPSKVMLDGRVDAIVSTSNAAQILELPAMDRVIGDLQSVVRDAYPGTWAKNPDYGPSLREDGSIIIDSSCYLGNGSVVGWSHKTCKNF